MPPIVHELVWPDRVVIGTVGSPGSRTFYLQAKAGRQVVSVALEKQQSAALAEKLDEILDQLMITEGNPLSVPEGTPVELVDNDPLDQPVEEQFRVGGISLGWEATTSQLVIEAYPLVDTDDTDDTDEEAEEVEPAELLRILIPVGTARAFAKRAREVVGAGRTICPFCGEPIDPEGHRCTARGGF